MFFEIPQTIAERMNPKELEIINKLNQEQNKANRFYNIDAETIAKYMEEGTMQAIIIYYPELDNFSDDEIDGGIYNNITIDDVREDIFENQGAAPRCPSIEELDEQIICYIPMVVSGKTYQERKNDLHEKAVEWSNNQGEYAAWSYGELGEIQDFFEKNGRRYGLLTEFRENAIC